jgi:UDP-N-acetylmuramoyl-L-alanyl-D-glutamate--2,6-diaminopimelate ligase
MAAIACHLADRVIITSDNPRTEDADTIIQEILSGVPRSDLDSTDSSVQTTQRVEVESDRASAIARAIINAHPGDTVLLAGKGHEDYQIIGTQKHHFDDREHAAAALQQWDQRFRQT